MKLITKQDLLKQLPAEWKYVYKENRKLQNGKFTEDIYEALKNETNLTEEKASAIIGNDSWTTIVCDICKQNQDSAVLVEELYICKSCLEAALSVCIR